MGRPHSVRWVTSQQLDPAAKPRRPRARRCRSSSPSSWERLLSPEGNARGRSCLPRSPPGSAGSVTDIPDGARALFQSAAGSCSSRGRLSGFSQKQGASSGRTRIALATFGKPLCGTMVVCGPRYRGTQAVRTPSRSGWPEIPQPGRQGLSPQPDRGGPRIPRPRKRGLDRRVSYACRAARFALCFERLLLREVHSGRVGGGPGPGPKSCGDLRPVASRPGLEPPLRAREAGPGASPSDWGIALEPPVCINTWSMHGAAQTASSSLTWRQRRTGSSG
jgi:hypothetical protein